MSRTTASLWHDSTTPQHPISVCSGCSGHCMKAVPPALQRPFGQSVSCPRPSRHRRRFALSLATCLNYVRRRLPPHGPSPPCTQLARDDGGRQRNRDHPLACPLYTRFPMGAMTWRNRGKHPQLGPSSPFPSDTFRQTQPHHPRTR
ncbi:hypothetical protein H310_12762 [Aphanomyces invadans]|uniref:Uncharacterized protein n=1 Tax=Aphanomyces invadans TaxID=157072 RepID=A0A024TGH4_9STRA|nr:hypothetical protein H310_12762 [Aphanomyces invadans]ETV93153.1 hypothetical protein H310_12762 [Aphanomyces invadans]|eukprot:XP_008878175.1 hypothetical protein H310_12762 [Aphanomyces invadans]